MSNFDDFRVLNESELSSVVGGYWVSGEGGSNPASGGSDGGGFTLWHMVSNFGR